MTGIIKEVGAGRYQPRPMNDDKWTLAITDARLIGGKYRHLFDKTQIF